MIYRQASERALPCNYFWLMRHFNAMICSDSPFGVVSASGITIFAPHRAGTLRAAPACRTSAAHERHAGAIRRE